MGDAHTGSGNRYYPANSEPKSEEWISGIDKTDFKHLELLLGKIAQELGGKRFCIIPCYIHDGCYLATYKDTGEVDRQITGIDIEDALVKITQSPNKSKIV